MRPHAGAADGNDAYPLARPISEALPQLCAAAEARRVLADVTRDGGYPPLMLDPIDFGRLYSQNLARGQGQASN